MANLARKFNPDKIVSIYFPMHPFYNYATLDGYLRFKRILRVSVVDEAFYLLYFSNVFIIYFCFILENFMSFYVVNSLCRFLGRVFFLIYSFLLIIRGLKSFPLFIEFTIINYLIKNFCEGITRHIIVKAHWKSFE